MNDQIIRKLAAFAVLSFAFLCLFWVALSYILIPLTEVGQDYSLLIDDPDWTLVSSIGLLSCIFGVFAVSGIYLVNRQTGGILLFIGTILLSTGIIFEIASLTWDVFVWPVVCNYDEYRSFVAKGFFIKSPQFMIFISITLVLLLSGSIITAISLYRIKKYGKMIPILIIPGIILYIVGNISIVYIASTGLVMFCLAFILLGIKILLENELLKN